jgi:hypothetical protein
MKRTCLLAVALALVVAVGAEAAGTTITLDLKAGYANRTLIACRIRHHYTFYHRGVTIAVAGVVQPTPTTSGWQVKVKVKRCVLGRFRAVSARFVPGHKDGSFYATFRFVTRGFLFARAYYYGIHPVALSDKQYLRIL